MKRKIRLTESDLHNIIKESVNTILNELDWRTYQSAAQKAGTNGDFKRETKFRHAATNAFNRQNGYGLKNVPNGDGIGDNMTFSKNGFYGGCNVYNYDGDEFETKSGTLDKDGKDLEKVYSSQKVSNSNGKRNTEREIKPNATNLNPMLKAKQMIGDKQVRDFYSGKTTYRPGKNNGWKNYKEL